MRAPDPEVYQPRLSVWGHTWRLRRRCSPISAPSAWLPRRRRPGGSPDCWSSPTSCSGRRRYVLVFFRRRWPVAVALVITLLAAVLAARRRARRPGRRLGGDPAALARDGRWSARSASPPRSSSGTDARRPTTTRSGSTSSSTWSSTVGDPRLGHVHRLAPRAALDPAPPRRARRGRAGAPGRAGAANERARIAREMHDVLAHRISQVSMHAGALAFREDLTPDAGARQRDGDPGQGARGARPTCAACSACCATPTASRARRPQPTYADLAELIAEARASGLHGRATTTGSATRRRGAGRGRPDGLPDRPGGHHQRPQARTRERCSPSS